MRLRFCAEGRPDPFPLIVMRACVRCTRWLVGMRHRHRRYLQESASHGPRFDKRSTWYPVPDLGIVLQVAPSFEAVPGLFEGYVSFEIRFGPLPLQSVGDAGLPFGSNGRKARWLC